MHVRLDHVAFQGKPTSRRAKRAGPSVSLRRGASPPAASAEAGGLLASFVLRRAGLRPEAYRLRPLVRRTSACLRALDAGTEADGILRLESAPATEAQALSAVLIGVTSFFRDAPVFAALETMVIPALARRATGVSAWSAGCASGAELYSLAMLLDEAGCLPSSTLLGTDCRGDAVRQAGDAVYEGSGLAGLDETRLRRHMTSLAPDRWRVSPLLTRHTAWRRRDVTGHLEAGPWDLVFWRNVSIYLRGDLADRITAGIVDRIRPGGYLVVGRAERPPDGLPLTRICRCIYRKDVHGA